MKTSAPSSLAPSRTAPASSEDARQMSFRSTRAQDAYFGIQKELGNPWQSHVAAAQRDAVQPLASPLGEKFARSLGTSFLPTFGDMRIHVGPASDRAARSVGARAFALGRDIHFARGEYRPNTAAGERLLAHEVSHTLQQRPSSFPQMSRVQIASPTDASEREADRAAESMVAGNRFSVTRREAGPVLRRTLSTDYPAISADLNGGAVTSAQANHALTLLNPLSPEDLGDTVAQLQRDGLMLPLFRNISAPDHITFSGLIASIMRWVGPTAQFSHIQSLLSGAVTADSAHIVLLILKFSTLGQERVLVQQMESAGLFPVFLANLAATDQSNEFIMLDRVASERASFNDRMEGTRHVDSTVSGNVQAVLNAGSAGIPSAAVFTDGVSPDTYREDIMESLDATRTAEVARINAMFTRTRIPMATFGTIGNASKAVTDNLFGRFASGPALSATGPNPNIRNQSAIAGDPADMIDYLINTDERMHPVHLAHNARPGNAAELRIINGVMRDYFSTRSGVSSTVATQRRNDMRLIDRGWPATAHLGVVRVQPFEGATPAETRRGFWDSFQTLIHEYLHTITHRNYSALADTLPRDQKDILVEGGTSLMTDKVWDSIFPEEIRANDALRQTVEGVAQAFDPAAIPPISHYQQIAQARTIESEVGEENMRAAYFLGQVELLGMGNRWNATLANEQNGFTVRPGMTTLADIAAVTGSTAFSIAVANGLAEDAAIAPGQVWAVPGLRLHVTVVRQTGARVAEMNGVTLAALQLANPGLPSEVLSAGTHVIIPVH